MGYTDEQNTQHEAPPGITWDATAVPVLGEAEPWHIPGLIPVSVHRGSVVQSSSQAAASAHSRGPEPLLTPFSLLPCLSFGPGGLAAGLAASTRNPGHGKQTKHRLSPGSRRASAWLGASPHPGRLCHAGRSCSRMGITSLPCLPPQQIQKLGLHTWTKLLP